MNDNGEFQRIYDQIEKQSDKIDHSTRKIEVLAESVAELAKVVVAKEVNDKHIQKSIDTLTAEVATLQKEVNSLKLISAGDETWRKLGWLGLTIVVGAIITAIVGLVVTK